MEASSPHALVRVDDAFRRAIAPDPDLLAWEWAERYRILPPDAAEPGPKSYDRTPYLREIAAALSPQQPWERIVLMKGAQIGGTDLGADWHGHTIHLSPSVILVVWPSAEFAQRKSRELFDPLIESTPVLRKLVAPPRSKDSQNTILTKRFPGGRLVMVGANSGIGLRSTAAQRVHLDEVDAFVQLAGKEGDPVRLAERATRTFKGRKKIYMVSTPLLEATSLINREFLRCDRVLDFHLPCPRCGAFQALDWKRMRYEVASEGETIQVADVHYVCVACDGRIENREKATMLPAGKWVARWDRGGTAAIGFHLSSLYSPVGWYAWEDAALAFEQAKGNPGEEQIFQNNVLGLPFSDAFEVVRWEPLHTRREPYAEGVVQPGCMLLTAGVDVQRDRLEVEVRGWGRDLRSWSLTYRVLVGDPAEEDVWRDLDTLLGTDWPTVGGDGTLPIWCCAIDSGDMPQAVYRWARRHPQPSFANGAVAVRTPRTVLVTKGRDKWHRVLLISEKASQEEKKRGLKVVGLGVSGLKKELYRNLRLPLHEDGSEPPGYLHWPETPSYNERFFKGLVAERLVVRLVRGRPTEVWELPGGMRNEPLDLHNLNRGAAAACGLDRMTAPDWDRLEKLVPASLKEGKRAAPADEAPAPPEPVVPTGPPAPEPSKPVATPPAPWRPPSTTWGRRTRFTGGGGWG